MMKKKRKIGMRMLTVLLTAVFLLTMCGTVALAEETAPAATDPAVGTPCAHLNADGTYSCMVAGAPADYVCDHADGCGFQATPAAAPLAADPAVGTPCTHLSADGTYSCMVAGAPADYVCDHTDGCGVQQSDGAFYHNIYDGSVNLSGSDGCSETVHHVVTGTSDINSINILSGTHYVELSQLRITTNASPISISDGASLNLTGHPSRPNETISYLKSNAAPAISVSERASLRTYSNFSVEAVGGAGGGIGSVNGPSGRIVIEQSIINVIGGGKGAGIGSGGRCIKTGDITIKSNSKVTAQGHYGAAGIGGGSGVGCGNITIADSEVVANGGGEAPGIGPGYPATDGRGGGNITISNSNVEAYGSASGAGIGGAATAVNIATPEGYSVIAAGSGIGPAVASSALSIKSPAVAKYKIDSAYTGQTNISRNMIWEGTAQLKQTQDIKIGAGRTVSYDANMGTDFVVADSHFANGDITVTDNGFDAPEGMEFAGWNTMADGSGEWYTEGDILAADADIVLYAQWKPIADVALAGVKASPKTGDGANFMLWVMLGAGGLFTLCGGLTLMKRKKQNV